MYRTTTNHNGIGDIPYPIPGGGSVDRYPLMQPWSDTPQKGDLNSDGILTPQTPRSRSRSQSVANTCQKPTSTETAASHPSTPS